MTEPSGLAAPAPHGFWRNIVLAWLAVCAILIVRTWSAIHSFQLAEHWPQQQDGQCERGINQP